MSTSLAQQLERLRVPQTTLLTQDKKRPSLLFEPGEAANLNRESIFQIGLDGLEELIDKNPIFLQFENNLFHLTSKDFERAVQSAEANQKLDSNIRRFLLLLSPYFLLNCSHKALEWLVNRFHIQEYNREDFLMLILPYHETNIFVRALQLLQFRDKNDKWYWLKALQKPGVHLPKKTLFNHTANDVYFIKFVSNFVLAVQKEHQNASVLTVAFNFYCTTLVGALESLHEVNEGVIQQILPALFQGLSSEVPDFCAASYVITAELLRKTQLQDKVLKILCKKISGVRVASLKTEAILVLVILYQSQEHYVVMSKTAVQKLISKEWLPTVLADLKGAGCYLKPFLDVFCRELLTVGIAVEKSMNYQSFLLKILSAIKLEASFIDNFLNAILDTFDPKVAYSNATEQWLSEIVSTIEKSDPDSFDSKIKDVMKETGGSKRQASLKKIFKRSFVRGHYDIFEKLYHPQAEIRKQAMKYVINNYRTIQDKEKDMLRIIFVDRLGDEDATIVKQVLGVKPDVLINVIGEKSLMDGLLRVFDLCRKDKNTWWNCTEKALSVLCSGCFKDEFEVFLIVLPFLLPIAPNELNLARFIFDSRFGKGCQSIKQLEKRVANCKNYEEFFNKVLINVKFAGGLEKLIENLKSLPDEERFNVSSSKFVICWLLSNTLPNNSSIETGCSVLEMFLKYSKETKFSKKTNDSAIDHIKISYDGKFSLSGFLQCMNKVVLKCKKRTSLDADDFSEETKQFYPLATAILLKHCYSADKIDNCMRAFDNFMAHSCVDVKSNVLLALNISVAESKYLDDDIKLMCLKYVAMLCRIERSDLFDESIRVNATVLLDFKSLAVPYLISSLNSPNANIRNKAFDIVEFFITKSKKRVDNYWLLLDGLFEQKNEIVLDHEQTPLVVYNTLFGDNKSETIQKTVDNLVMIATGALHNPIYLSAQVLIIMSHVNNVDIISKLSKLAMDLLMNNESLDQIRSCVVYYIILRFESNIACGIDLDTDIWRLMVEIFTKEVILCYNETVTCAPVLLLNQLNCEFFDSLRSNVQERLIDLIVSTIIVTKNHELIASAGHFFKHIDLDVGLIVGVIKTMCEVQSPKQSESRLKRRVGTVPTADILDTSEWKKGVAILEFIQDKKKIKNTTVLLPLLFNALKRCLDFDEQTIVEYPKQLLLSTILHCCDKTDVKQLPENVFKMDLVVQCIRISQNPQTHHHALLLLADMAPLIPDQVLHNIMSIFTFMGSSVLRQDDAYSFQIITKIIDTIIPILISEGDTDKNIGKVLRVFVDAILDVAEHRRMPLYIQLLNKIEPNRNLHLFLLLIFEAHVMHSHAEKQKIDTTRSLANIEDVPRRLDIAASLCCQFLPDIIIQACIDLIKYLSDLPVEKTNSIASDPNCITFDIAHHTAKQFRHYKYILITFIANFLASREFVNKIAVESDEKMLQLEPLFKTLIISILSYIHVTSKLAERNQNTPQAQYWKVMLHHAYDILDSLNALLTPQMFLLVTIGLMGHSLPTIRRRAIELLNTKLQYSVEYFDACDKTEVYALIPHLMNIIKTIENPEVQPDQEVIIQTAFLSLKLLVKIMAPKEPQKFVQMLNFMTDVVKSDKSKDNILASAILCLAELYTNLRAHAIPSLSKFVPSLLKILKKQKQQDSPSLLLLSTVVAVLKLLESLPLFISSYLIKLLTELSLIWMKFCSSPDDPKMAPMIKKMADIKEKFGASVPARVLIPAIEGAYANLIKKANYGAIEWLMIVLCESLSNLQTNDVQANLPDLTTFFLNSLEFRSHFTSLCIDEVNLVESNIIKALTTLILKLSEGTFRPLYYKIYDWAVRGEEKDERVITFYGISSGIAERLKGLFVLFAGHFLNNAANLLDSCNLVKNTRLYFDNEDNNVLLLENILKTLHSVFLHNTQRFINKERFEVLMQPLVDQLENTVGGVVGIQKRNTILIPCIVQFAVATADDSLWKQLNYQILLKLRHTDATIRLAGLECFTEMAKKLGDDFLPLLPETIPFLAELLEDEDESVERACQRSVQELEKVLGEPLQKYF